MPPPSAVFTIRNANRSGVGARQPVGAEADVRLLVLLAPDRVVSRRLRGAPVRPHGSIAERPRRPSCSPGLHAGRRAARRSVVVAHVAGRDDHEVAGDVVAPVEADAPMRASRP